MATIVVTGAASGIGAATVDRLKRDGHRVVGVDVQPTDVVADLASAAGRAAALAGIRAATGGGIDGLVSGAALGPTCAAEPVARVNYFGALAMLDETREMLAQGEAPSAVAISSIGAVFEALVVPAFVEACLAGDEEAAVRAIADKDGNTAYVNAKHALALAVRQRAADWGAAGIRLNAVLPGTIETPMLDAIHAHEGLGPAVKAMPIPIGRTAQPSEIADVITFLLGPDARFVHGAMIHADGGSDALVRPEVL